VDVEARFARNEEDDGNRIFVISLEDWGDTRQLTPE